MSGDGEGSSSFPWVSPVPCVGGYVYSMCILVGGRHAALDWGASRFRTLALSVIIPVVTADCLWVVPLLTSMPAEIRFDVLLKIVGHEPLEPLQILISLLGRIMTVSVSGHLSRSGIGRLVFDILLFHEKVPRPLRLLGWLRPVCL